MGDERKPLLTTSLFLIVDAQCCIYISYQTVACVALCHERRLHTILIESITNFWVNFDKLVQFQLFRTVLIYLTLFVGDQAVASSGSLFFSEQREKGLSFSQGKVLVVCM